MRRVSSPLRCVFLVSTALALASPAFSSETAIEMERASDEVAAILDAIYGDRPRDVAVADFDRNGTLEILVHHNDGCSPVFEDLAEGVSVFTCAWSVVQEVEMEMMETLTVPAWRAQWVLGADGQPVGVDFDGRVWTGESGYMLPKAAGFAWTPLAEAGAAEITALEGAEGVDDTWVVAPAPAFGEGAAITWQKGGGNLWQVVGREGLIVRGSAQGEPTLVESRIGMSHIIDSAGGAVLATASLPLEADVWRSLWETPDLQEGWSPVVLERIKKPESDADGLWRDAEIASATSFPNWLIFRASVEIEGGTLILSSLSSTCAKECELRGKIVGSDGSERAVLFDGQPATQACIASPEHVQVDALNMTLRACDKIIQLSAG